MAYCGICGTKILDEMAFCGKCGEEIDSRLIIEKGVKQGNNTNEKKDKQKKVAIIILVIFVVLFGSLNLYQFSYVQDMWFEISELDNEIENQNDAIENLNGAIERRDRSITSLQNKINTLENDLARTRINQAAGNWFQSNIALIPDNGSKQYHRFDCSVWQDFTSSGYYYYWAYPYESADRQGYRPHSCWNETKLDIPYNEASG